MYKSIRSSRLFSSFLFGLLFFAFAFLSFSPLIASAAQVTLAWDSNTESDLAGYIIYYDIASGHPYNGDDAHEGDSGEIIVDKYTTTITLTGLSDDETYYFAVTAYNTEDLESYYSNEVSRPPVTDTFGQVLPIINSYAAIPSTIGQGETATLSWNITGADSATIDNWVGNVDPSNGSHVVSPTDTALYKLTATNGVGLVTHTVSVTVVQSPLDVDEDVFTYIKDIEAEEMNYHANGRQEGEYWLLWSNGTMNEDVYFQDTGIYRFEITARADLAFNIGPEMELFIDGENKGAVFVNTNTPEIFVFNVEVSAGMHEIAIGFFNDFYDPSRGIDRNLYVDKTIILFSPDDVTPPDDVTMVIEAEEMDYHANGIQEGEYWKLWSSGTMNEDVYFQDTGIYRFEITARADLAFDIGPEMELFIDGEHKGSFFVNTIAPETFVFNVEISAGMHDIAIGFYNDFCDHSQGIDRNLYVDNTIISYQIN